ncbi:MAG: 50S ribosomal protein L6 [Patescibacteria group bacterium]
MSKIGKRPIKIEEGVEIKIADQNISASFNGKTSELTLPREIGASVEDGNIQVSRANDTKVARSLHGLYARLISNIIHGVKEGFLKELTFTGTGYRAAISGNELVLNMGYSHEIRLAIPQGLEVKVVKNTIQISGMDKSSVGQFAAVVREVRPPEVYKGKGIKYKDEHIRRKAGKTAASK